MVKIVEAPEISRASKTEIDEYELQRYRQALERIGTALGLPGAQGEDVMTDEDQVLRYLRTYCPDWMPAANPAVYFTPLGESKRLCELELYGGSMGCLYNLTADRYDLILSISPGTHRIWLAYGPTLRYAIEYANSPSVHESVTDRGVPALQVYYQFLDAMGLGCPICTQRKELGI